MMPDAGIAQDVDDFAHGEGIAALPNQHDFLFALPLVKRMPAQLFGHQFDTAHATHRVTVGIFCIANGTISH